jgi:hypothetical protein
MVITHTYTKTYTLLDPWASTLPLVEGKCAVKNCGKPLRLREECYGVTQLEGWVCWRHIRPDDGPIRV